MGDELTLTLRSTETPDAIGDRRIVETTKRIPATTLRSARSPQHLRWVVDEMEKELAAEKRRIGWEGDS